MGKDEEGSGFGQIYGIIMDFLGTGEEVLETPWSE
jgi:hypothetical protein